MAHKIIVIGDVDGRITELVSYLTKQHAKVNFSFGIIVGNLFADPQTASDSTGQDVSNLLEDQLTIPFPLYFALGDRPIPTEVVEKLKSNMGELCSNLTALGRKVSIKTAEGFKIAAIGGKHASASESSSHEYSSVYTDGDVEAAKSFAETDILITSEWPADIGFGSRKNTQFDPSPPDNENLSHLSNALKPKYHFSRSSTFFEREPFFHSGTAPFHITRFISLTPMAMGKGNGKKWVYAFSLEPSAKPRDTLEPDCTASPFTNARKRRLESENNTFDATTYDKIRDQSHSNREKRSQHTRRDDRSHHNKRHKAAPPPTPQQCWFCMTNESFERHMVGSIGTDVYVAVAKGPLSTRETFPELGFPCHMLILPVIHAPSIASLPESERATTLLEMKNYRNAMSRMVADLSRNAKGKARLGSVTWAVSRGQGVHHNWQFLPFDADKIENGLVEVGFDVEAENLAWPKFVKTVPEMGEAEEGEYFKVMLWTENMQRDIVLALDGSFRFNWQFGRTVMAKLLERLDRLRWEDCGQNEAEETSDTQAFRKASKEYALKLE